MTDNRSKNFIFVPFCLMAQAYQAQGIVKYEWKSSIKPFLNLLIEKDINIIQMPCTEATFENNLIRQPKGIAKYNTEKFNEHCEKISKEVSNQISNIIENGYNVMIKTKGLFIEKLYNKINKYNIPIIGINRKFINKSLRQLETIIDNTKN